MPFLADPLKIVKQFNIIDRVWGMGIKHIHTIGYYEVWKMVINNLSNKNLIKLILHLGDLKFNSESELIPQFKEFLEKCPPCPSRLYGLKCSDKIFVAECRVFNIYINTELKVTDPCPFYCTHMSECPLFYRCHGSILNLSDGSNVSKEINLVLEVYKSTHQLLQKFVIKDISDLVMNFIDMYDN
jgi:hypothetical protein